MPRRPMLALLTALAIAPAAPGCDANPEAPRAPLPGEAPKAAPTPAPAPTPVAPPPVRGAGKGVMAPSKAIEPVPFR